MPLTVYTPTVDEVIASLAEHLKTNPLLMLVAVTDSDDPSWRGGDHINFNITNTAKGWIMEGSNGMKIKLSGKEIVAKAKKEVPAEAVPEVPAPEVTPETPPANP